MSDQEPAELITTMASKASVKTVVSGKWTVKDTTLGGAKSRIPRAKRSSVVHTELQPDVKVEHQGIAESVKPNVVRKSKNSVKSNKSEMKENVRPLEKNRAESQEQGGEVRRHLSVLDMNRAREGSRYCTMWMCFLWLVFHI